MGAILTLRLNILESGQRDSNARHQPWQGRALPLSYARIITLYINTCLLLRHIYNYTILSLLCQEIF